MVSRFGVVFAALVLAVPAPGQAPKPQLPDPVKFIHKSDVVWKVVRGVLDEMGYSIELEDRTAGRIVTKPDEFVTGSLTSTEIDKVANKSDSAVGTWVKARYSVETILEVVTPNETLLTVRTRMEGLNRDLDGTEKWVQLQSLGVYEKRVLGRVSIKLLGDELPFEEKKGFWDKSPQPVDSRRPKPYPTRPPE